MARPRKTETRRSVTIRLDNETITWLDLEAKRRGVTRTQLIELAVFRHFRPPLRDGDEWNTDDVILHTSTHELEIPPCRHPKADRQVHAWGSICGVCNKRI